MIHRQHYSVYIADRDKSGGVYHFDFSDGRLVLKEKTDIDRPMYLALSGNKIYTILQAPFSENEYSGINNYILDENGNLTCPSELVSTEGAVSCHLCVKDGMIFDANYVSGSVNKLGEKTVKHTGKGINPERQEAAHVHFTNVSPDGDYLLVCDLGLDTVFVYDFMLNEVSKAKVPDGHGVRHLAYSEDGKTVYSADELESAVSVFDYNDGVLNYVTTVSGLPEGFVGENTAAAIRVEKDRLYISQRGYDGVCVFDISEKIPKFIESFKSGGKSPRDFDLIDNYIIVTNESGEVCVFNRDTYELLQTYELTSPLCVVYKE